MIARLLSEPVATAAALTALGLILAVYIGLTSTRFVLALRRWAAGSHLVAFAVPFVLLGPYLIYAFGTGTFSLWAMGKLAAYIGVPVALLLPDRLHRAERIGWRDFAAMLSLVLPIAGRWLNGVFSWPVELYFFQPLLAVCIGGYAFIVVRNLEDVGYRLAWRNGDGMNALANFAGFAVLAIPLGYWLGFINFHSEGLSWPTAAAIVGTFFGMYLTIAIPEEMVFRGIFQNLLARSIRLGPPGLYALLIASIVFGLSHLDDPPVPNWRYAIMATLAGLFYGNAYRLHNRISASALTHALVNTLWVFWF